MSHPELCAALDLAKAALDRRDYLAADRIRSNVYGSGLPLSWFVAEQVGYMIADARAEDRSPTAVDLMLMAGERAA